MKKIFHLLSFLGLAALSHGQVTTNGGAGLAANYANLNDAITALNAATITSPVIITLSGNETAPSAGYTITAQGTVANTITITATNPSVTITANPALTPNALNDGIIKLVGADYVTLTGFTIRENAGNITTDPGTNNMAEWGVALLPASGTNGAQNNTIRSMNIGLNKSYPNSFAIYASTAHTAADATTVADITAASGGNDNLAVISNTISNVNIPIAVVGSPAFPGLGLNIGGSSNSDGNIITDWGTTGFYSAFARFDNLINANVAAGFFSPVPGILAVNQLAPNISHNTLISSTTGNADGALVGIYAPSNGMITYPGTPLTTNIIGNKLNLYSNVFGAAAAVPLIYGIRVHTGDAVSTLHIDTTELLGVNHVTPNSPGADTLIYSFAQVKHLTMNANKFQNLQIAQTGTLAFIGIHNRVFMPVAGTQHIKNNIITGISRSSTGAVGSTTAILRPQLTGAVATDGSEDGSTFNVENNIFSNINTNGGGVAFVSNGDGKLGLPTLSKNIVGNIISNIDLRSTTSTQTSASFSNLCIFANRGGVHLFSNNLIENLNASNNAIPASSGFLTGFNLGNYNTGMSLVATGNIFRSWDGGTLIGITTAVPANISNNQLYDFIGRQTTGTSGLTVINITSIPSGATINITKNKIGNITNNSVGAIAAISAGALANIPATLNIYNNTIGDLKTPLATSLNAITGIYLANGNQLVADVAHNTIYLNATSSGATFGSSCIFFNAVVSSLKLRNNILMNLSTPAQEGLNINSNGVSATLRRSTLGTLGLAPANYDVASNNNLFYVNPTAGTNNHMTYLEGGTPTTQGTPTITNAQNTLAQFQAFMANRDQASVTENTNNSPFKSMDVTSPDFLHVAPQFIFAANNAGMALNATVADDIEGEARHATTPDMGADEYVTSPDAWLLPVGLVSLSGTKQGTDNLLTWITASEQNNRGFDVQRSTNGNNFATIAQVNSKAANGNSNSALSYQFTDRKVAAGNLYYRLVQTDLDGKKHNSNIIVIAGMAPSTASFERVYPNPANSNVTLLVNSMKYDKATLAITNANGTVMLQQNVQVVEGTNSINVNVRGLAAGLYFISVNMSQLKTTQTLRFIKQ